MERLGRILDSKGYDVHFFTTTDQLLSALHEKRASTIIISTLENDVNTPIDLSRLLGLNELNGVRMILSLDSHDEKAKHLAACANFRDIIPLDLAEVEWAQRFVYATAGRPLQFIQPTGQISLNNISAAYLPARITWISNERIRIECKVRPPIGATLILSGQFAKDLDVPSMTLQVERVLHQHLIYRFSDAIIARWNVPSNLKAQALRKLERLRAAAPQSRHRVFVAMQSAKMRTQILNYLDDPNFEVTAALQKQSIITEPVYFTPDVVIFEDLLFRDDDGARFTKMVKNLQPGTPIIIIGQRVNLDRLRKDYRGHRFIGFPKVPSALLNILRTKVLSGNTASELDANAVQITKDQPYSVAEVSFPARLTKIHPLSGSISLPYQIGNFALLRLESPLIKKVLGRTPYFKCTSTYRDLKPESGQFIHIVDGYLADVDKQERGLIGQHLSKIVSTNMNRYDTGDIRDTRPKEQTHRTPELGVVSILPMPIADSDPEPLKKAVGDDFTDTALFEPVAYAAKSNDFRDMVTRTATQPKTKRKRNSIPIWTIQNLIKLIAVFAILAGIFWAMFAVVAPNWKKSGKVYSDSLIKFAPHRFGPDAEKGTNPLRDK